MTTVQIFLFIHRFSLAHLMMTTSLGKKKNKVFITIPRFATGVPASVGTITERTHAGNPTIAPYPSWRWHKHLEDCPRDRIVSAFRIKVDECGRLWVLDSGRLVNTRICPAQILAFDLKTDELIHRYEIPDDQLQSNSILVTPIVDVRDPHSKCRDTFVYAADCQGFSIIVYDVKRGISWKVSDKTMYPSPEHGTYKIAGEQFELMDGMLGMDLSPYVPGEDRVLFYHAMSSTTEHWVYTSHLRNQSIFAMVPNAAPHIFHTYPGRRPSQAPAQAIDKKGISYFGLASQMSLNCWNTNTDYGEKNIAELVQNDITLQFPSGVKVVKNRRGEEELWVLTMRFQKIAAGTLNPAETNFRILAGNVEELTRGSKCLNTMNINSGDSANRPNYGGYGYGKRNNKRETSHIYYPYTD